MYIICIFMEYMCLCIHKYILYKYMWMFLYIYVCMCVYIYINWKQIHQKGTVVQWMVKLYMELSLYSKF